MQVIVFLLCFLASAGCAALLVASFLRTRTRLLLWTALCFVLLAGNNLVLVVDVVVLPSLDLLPLRQIASLGAVSVLIFGFIWDAD